MARIEVKSLTAQDWRALKQARLAALLDAPDAFGQPYKEAQALGEAEWRELAAGLKPPTFFVAFEDESPCGLIGGVCAGAEYHLISMWVSPESRGSAAAVRLVDVVMGHARDKGFDAVYLWVSENNPRACRFYEREGFVSLDEVRPLRSNPAISTRKMRRPVLQSGG